MLTKKKNKSSISAIKNGHIFLEKEGISCCVLRKKITLFHLDPFFFRTDAKATVRQSMLLVYFDWLFHGFDYFRFPSIVHKNQCCARFHVYIYFFDGSSFHSCAMKFFVAHKHNIFTLTLWSFVDKEKLIDKSVSIRLTYHGLIDFKSVDIYLSFQLFAASTMYHSERSCDAR